MPLKDLGAAIARHPGPVEAAFCGFDLWTEVMTSDKVGIPAMLKHVREPTDAEITRFVEMYQHDPLDMNGNDYNVDHLPPVSDLNTRMEVKLDDDVGTLLKQIGEIMMTESRKRGQLMGYVMPEDVTKFHEGIPSREQIETGSAAIKHLDGNRIEVVGVDKNEPTADDILRAVKNVSNYMKQHEEE